MNDNVTKLKWRLQSKKFAEQYPRHYREEQTLRAVDLSERDVLKYVVPPEPGYVYGVAAEPQSGYVKAVEIDLQEVLSIFNQLLIYRIFHLLYGQPDVLSCYASLTE